MPNPQQPELRRSGLSATTAEDAPLPPNRSAGAGGKRSGAGPDAIPEDNRPGHHPEHEQDKPTGPPPTPRAARRARKGTRKARGTATAA